MLTEHPEFLGFVCVFAVIAILALVPVMLHTALFGTLFYALVRHLRERQTPSRPTTCSHCGTMRMGLQSACENCGAPFDVKSPPTV